MAVAAPGATEVALHLQTAKYIKMAGLAILVFDYCIKLGDEIHFTWGRRWGFVRILFAVARYMPFAFISVDLFYSLGPKSSRHCLMIYYISSWINIISILAAESTLLLVRTYILCGRSKILLATLLIIALGCVAGYGAISFHGWPLFAFQDPPSGTSGCYQTQRIDIYSINYALLGFYETVILFLNVWHQCRRPASSRFLTELYWDGSIYVVCILAMSVANIVVIDTFPPAYVGSVRTLQAVFHSVLSSRLLFSLRAIMQHQSERNTDTSPQTHIQFDQDISLHSKRFESA